MSVEENGSLRFFHGSTHFVRAQTRFKAREVVDGCVMDSGSHTTKRKGPLPGLSEDWLGLASYTLELQSGYHPNNIASILTRNLSRVFLFRASCKYVRARERRREKLLEELR